jgi:membrane-associated phospholipid phosphatase
MSAARSLFVLAAVALGPSMTVSAQEVVHPWQRVGAGLERAYAWPNTLFHVSAAATTPPLALWIDEPVQEHFQQHDPLGDPFGTGALIVGGVGPIAVPAALYLTGLVADDAELATAGAAAVQAAAMQAIVVTTLKWLTDRAGPYPDGDESARRWSAGYLRDSKSATDFNFNPFDLEGGVRWPSGHTAGTIAMVSALVAYYPDELWIALIGYPVTLAVGVGMIEGDYHWLSDVVAGALIGHVIGWQIGREFRETYDRRARGEALSTPDAEGRVALVLVRGGLGLSGAF